MPAKMRMSTRLKELFERPEMFIIAGGMNAMGARMAQLAGYEAFYMSGANTSAHLLGMMDTGTHMREMIDNARRIVMAVDIPVFADMETGYGDAIAVYHTVKEYIQAGAAGVHLEDQAYPHSKGPRRQCISTQEMIGKLRAAMDAKMELDPDFVIVARCDYAGVAGATFQEAVERCLAYKREANVDVVCPEGLKSWTRSWRQSALSLARCCPSSLTVPRYTPPWRSSRMRAPRGAGTTTLQPSQRYRLPGTFSTISRSGAPQPWMTCWSELLGASGAR